MKEDLNMKKLLSFLLAVTVFIGGMSPQSVHASEELPNSENFTVNSISYNEVITDTHGNTIKINVSSQDDDIYSLVYVNEKLTQQSIINFAKDEIIYTDFQKVSPYNTMQRLPSGTYNCSAFIQDASIDEPSSNKESINTYAFDKSGWAYYGYYQASPVYANSKPCTLYFYNYDENPYDNRYLAKNISVGVGTPVSIVVGLIGSFLTDKITAITIITAFGASVIADVITNAISGQICYSTQKIRYAPVISGVNIFTDAYITKRYVITYDNLNGNMSCILDREAYDFNRGETPALIALNAQICELSLR